MNRITDEYEAAAEQYRKARGEDERAAAKVRWDAAKKAMDESTVSDDPGYAPMGPDAVRFQRDGQHLVVSLRYGNDSTMREQLRLNLMEPGFDHILVFAPPIPSYAPMPGDTGPKVEPEPRGYVEIVSRAEHADDPEVMGGRPMTTEPTPDLRAALRDLQSILNGILSDGPVIDSMDAEGPWWTPPDPTGVRLREAIVNTSRAVDAALAATPSEPDGASEYGRLLAERDRLVEQGVDPADLLVPDPPSEPDGAQGPLSADSSTETP